MDPQVVTLPLRPLAVRCRTRLRAHPQPAAAPSLSVVVVNYRHWAETARLVRKLRASTCLRRGQAEVVVVDNNSPADQTMQQLRRLAVLRRWRRNRGFARAVNEGCRLSAGDWLLLLNPDVTLEPGFLDEVRGLTQRLERESPHVGIVGFQLRNSDASQQLSAGPFPTLPGVLARLVLPRWRRKYTQGPAETRREVDWLTGCCLLVRRRCWETLGGFDRDFFLYYEDVDLCRRARTEGWTVLYEPALTVIHHQPLHGRQVPAHMRLITRHALLTYARKHWPGWQSHLLGRIVQLEALARKWWARFSGRPDDAQTFAKLGKLAVAMRRNRPERAERLLRRVMQHQEEQFATLSVHCHSQPQPTRPAAPMPEQRLPTCTSANRGAGR